MADLILKPQPASLVLQAQPGDATVPGAVQDLVAFAGNATIIASWNPPAFTGGSPVTGYTVRLTNEMTGQIVHSESGVGFTSYQFTAAEGVANGTPFFVSVAAQNVGGTGAYTDSEMVTPEAGGVAPTVPGAVDDLVAAAGNRTVTAAWSEPEDDGNLPIVGYHTELRLRDSGTLVAQIGAASRSVQFGIVDGVVNDVEYYVRVRAVNVEGGGPWTESNAVVPRSDATVPTAPQAVTATPGVDPGTVTVAWAPPASDGGSPVVRYRIVITPVP